MSRETKRSRSTCRYNAAMMALLVVSLMPQVAKALEPDGWVVDGEHGELYVHGLLTEGACRLDMASARQDVDMGSLTLDELQTPGAEGMPVMVNLHLKDCIRTRGYSLNMQLGTHMWDSVRPVVTVTFLAPEDLDHPSLLKVAGVGGLALRVTDDHHRIIHPGERSAPQFVPMSDQLTYIITPVRTAAPLVAGKYHMMLNFGLSYD